MSAKKKITARKTAKQPAKKAAPAVKKAAKKAPAKKAARKVAKKSTGKRRSAKTPGQLQIATAAYLNWRHRLSSGLAGDDLSDWFAAERTLAR